MALDASGARTAILALANANAQSGQAFMLIARALDFLIANPADAGVRFLLARALHAAGFPDLALEHLRLLPNAAHTDARVRELAAAVGPEPASTRLEPDEILARVSRTLSALSARGVALDAAFSAACTAEAQRLAREERWHAATLPAPGVTPHVLRFDAPRSNTPATRLLNAGEAPDSLASLLTAALGPTRPEDRGPILLDTLSPPTLLAELIARTPPTDNGYVPLVRVVEPDPARLARFAAACAESPALAASPRVRWFLGPAAADGLARDLDASMEAQLAGPIVSAAPAGSPSPAATTLQRAMARQEALVRDAAGLAARAPRRDVEHWAARFAAPGPRRVLIPTCRFSTFIRHSAEDLASAFRAAGHEARVLIEPDAHTRLSRLAYQRTLADFDPDLVVAINFPRAALGRLFPDDLPFVCWVQDAMPHLFRAEIGRAQGDFDFLAGHFFDPMFRRFGYPRSRFLYSPVTVHTPKFARPHDTPAPRTCELAFVTNHAEPPAAMHERLCAEADDPAIRRLFDLLRPEIAPIIDRLHTHAAEPALRDAAAHAARQSLGTDPDAGLIDQLVAQYAAPMAERTARHQTIAWAASIARRRGWRFTLFGRGWERQPDFADFARGPAEHGPELRDAYASAALQLHVSIHANAHQRLAECALAGGLTGVRLSRTMLGEADQALLADGVTLDCTVEDWRSAETICPKRTWAAARLADRMPGVPLITGPTALARAALLQRLGIDDPNTRDGLVYVNRRRLAALAADAPADAHEFTITRLLGDLAEVCFTNERELEDLTERAIDRPAWRDAAASMARNRAARAFTTHAFVTRLLAKVTSTLDTLALRRAQTLRSPLTPSITQPVASRPNAPAA